MKTLSALVLLIILFFSVGYCDTILEGASHHCIISCDTDCCAVIFEKGQPFISTLLVLFYIDYKDTTLHDLVVSDIFNPPKPIV